MSVIEGGLSSGCSTTAMILKIIGLLIVLKYFLRLITIVYKLIRKRKNLKERYGAGSWAFITGSSEGIGKGIAQSLAKQGFNIIISARRQKVLEEVKQEILQKCPNIEVKVLVADYSKGHEWPFISSLLDQISMLDISIVVNNVGVDAIEHYTKTNPQKIEQIIKLNCFPCAFITRYFIPILIERKKNKNLRSAIVNVASVAGVVPIPLMAPYSASKTFVDRLTQSVSYEYPEIDLLSFCPAGVTTTMSANKKDFLTISPEECAEGLLDQLGQKQKVTFGHWKHRLQGWFCSTTPERIFNYLCLNSVGPAEMKRREQYQKKQS